MGRTGDRLPRPGRAQVIERGRDVSLGFVVCGGNVTQHDVRGWFDRLL